jgi:hypothetical protein
MTLPITCAINFVALFKFRRAYPLAYKMPLLLGYAFYASADYRGVFCRNYIVDAEKVEFGS